MIPPDAGTEGPSGPRFPLGKVVATVNAARVLSHDEMFAGLARHVMGDWGEICDEDWQANEQALAEGTRLLSAYRSAAGLKFWIITEADRSSTTVLFPEEY